MTKTVTVIENLVNLPENAFADDDLHMLVKAFSQFVQKRWHPGERDFEGWFVASMFLELGWARFVEGSCRGDFAIGLVITGRGRRALDGYKTRCEED